MRQRSWLPAGSIPGGRARDTLRTVGGHTAVRSTYLDAGMEYPVDWREVPSAIRKELVAENQVSKRNLKEYW
jgi:hypothetical protein